MGDERGQKKLGGVVAVVDKIAPCYALKNSSPFLLVLYFSIFGRIGNRRCPQWKVLVGNKRFFIGLQISSPKCN